MSLEVQVKPQVLPPAEGRLPAVISSGERLTLMELWRVLMKQRVVVLIVTIVSLAAALLYALRTPPVFESMARIEIRPQETANIGIDQLIEQKAQGQPQNDLQTEVSILQSDSVLFQTAQSMNLLDRVRAASAANARKKGRPVPPVTAEITPMERRAMIELIRSGLAVKVINGTNLVEIRYRNGDPKLGAAIVNRLVETYQDEDLRTKYERTMHVTAWLQKQLQGLKTEASNAQQQLADYQKAHNIVGDENSNLTFQALQDISSSLDDAEADRIMKEVRMRDFEAMNSNMVAVMGDNPNLANLRSHLQDLETQRAQIATKFASKHPRMIELQSQIDKVQGQIDAEVALARRQVRDQYDSAAGVERALRARLDAQKEAAYKLNEGAAQSEKTPFYPRSPYGVAKLYAYWITVNYREAYGMHASNGILFNHESPIRGETFVTRKITRAVAAIHLGVQKTLYIGNLDSKRDWGHARDYVEGMWRIVQQPEPDDFVLATGETHSVREFVERAFSQVGRSIGWKGKDVDELGVDTRTGEVLVRIDPRYFRPTEVDLLLGDPSKARRILGWQHKVTFSELVSEMVQFDLEAIAREFRQSERSYEKV